MAIDEPLHGSKGSCVFFILMFNQRKRSVKLCAQILRAVSHNLQSTAFQRAIFSESRKNQMAAWLDRVRNSLDICGAIMFFGQKMKCRAIMPEVKGMIREFDFGHVAVNPLHAAGGTSELFLRGSDRG